MVPDLPIVYRRGGLHLLAKSLARRWSVATSAGQAFLRRLAPCTRVAEPAGLGVTEFSERGLASSDSRATAEEFSLRGGLLIC